MARIKSFRTKGFKKLFAKLPTEVKKTAKKDYQAWLRDPYHPSLQFKIINKNKSIYSARVGISWRVLEVFNKAKNEVVWFWIGSHEEYNQLVKK